MPSRFQQALDYAAGLHAAQERKGSTVPYVAHLLGVASLVLYHGGTEDEAIAALLHDAIEDQGGDETRQEIRGHFGPVVAEIVEGCTDTDEVPKPPWRPRKEAYIAHVRRASPSVRLVSAADKLDNARSILRDYRAVGEAVWKRFTGGREGTLWYYRALVQAFRETGTNPLVEELAEVVSQIEHLAGR